jgi:hypothetical protein
VIVQQLLDVAAWHVLLDDEEVARHGARAHEQADVRMEECATRETDGASNREGRKNYTPHDCDFAFKGSKVLFVHNRLV